MHDMVIFYDEKGGGVIFRARDFRGAALEGNIIQVVVQTAHDSYKTADLEYDNSDTAGKAFEGLLGRIMIAQEKKP